MNNKLNLHTMSTNVKLNMIFVPFHFPPFNNPVGILMSNYDYRGTHFSQEKSADLLCSLAGKPW